MGGWSQQESSNKLFRENIVLDLQYDVLGLCETFLQNEDSLTVEGYTWYGNNHSQLHKRAKRGSGGVGALFKNSFLKDFSVEILDNNFNDMIWF